MFSNDPQKTRLAELIREADSIDDVLLGHEAGHLVGHVVLDMLEERGFPADEFDAVASVPTELPLALSVMHAASSRGMDINTLVLDDAGIRGPHQRGDKVVLVSVRAGAMRTGVAAGDSAVAGGIDVVALASLIGADELAVFTNDDLA